MLGFQQFLSFLHHLVLTKVATSSIRVDKIPAYLSKYGRQLVKKECIDRGIEGLFGKGRAGYGEVEGISISVNSNHYGNQLVLVNALFNTQKQHKKTYSY